MFAPEKGAFLEYTGSSLLSSPMDLGKSDLYGDMTVLQGLTYHSLQYGIQCGTAQGWP